MRANVNLYDVLGIRPSAAPEEVRRAFRQRALQTHPDKLGPDVSEAEKQAAEAKFHEVATANEVLGDAEKRKAYDEGLVVKSNIQRAAAEAKARRAKEREERAQEQERLHKARMEELHQRNAQMKAQLKKHVSEARQQEEVIRNLLHEMDTLQPEWRMRRELAEKQKAARMHPNAIPTEL